MGLSGPVFFNEIHVSRVRAPLPPHRLSSRSTSMVCEAASWTLKMILRQWDMKILAFKQELLINPNLTWNHNKTKQPQSSNIYNELRAMNSCGCDCGSDAWDANRGMSGARATSVPWAAGTGRDGLSKQRGGSGGWEQRGCVLCAVLQLRCSLMWLHCLYLQN